MTRKEIEALTLFKDYSFLKLKLFKADYLSKMEGKAGGQMETEELDILNRALELHSQYTSFKISQSKNVSGE